MVTIKSVFWNEVEQRIRAGWRILAYTLLWLFAPALVNFLIGHWLVTPLARAFPPIATLTPHVIAIFLKLGIVLVGTWLAAYLLDRRPVADYGFYLNQTWWLDFSFGLVLGALLMTLIFAIEWFLGWVTITQLFRVALPGISFAAGIGGALLFFGVVSITEELLARGYQLRNLAEGLNFPAIGAHGAVLIAWVISSLLFGLLHVFNPNATWYTTLALMLAGLFLGLGYVLTGRLAIPLGLHMTWNFFQGNVFGFPVSGNAFDGVTLFAIQQSGPPLWTGGAFGPEAGLLGMLAILLGMGITALWVRWRDRKARLVTALAEYKRGDQSLAAVKEIGDW